MTSWLSRFWKAQEVASTAVPVEYDLDDKFKLAAAEIVASPEFTALVAEARERQCQHHWHVGPDNPYINPNCAVGEPEPNSWYVTSVQWCCRCDKSDIVNHVSKYHWAEYAKYHGFYSSQPSG